LQPHFEISGFERGDYLACSRLASQVDLDLAHPARDLETQCGLLISGERSRRCDRVSHPASFGFRQLNMLGRQTRRAPSGTGDLRLAAAAPKQK
jgi:hypothetical protein